MDIPTPVNPTPTQETLVVGTWVRVRDTVRRGPEYGTWRDNLALLKAIQEQLDVLWSALGVGRQAAATDPPTCGRTTDRTDTYD